MKKVILAAALMTAVGFAGINLAEARWGGGWGPGNGPGGGYCNGPRWGNVDPATVEAQEKFYNDTSQLRQQIWDKKREYREIMSQDSPDKDLAQQVWSEMFDLKVQMRQMAEEAGIEPGLRGRGDRYNRGFGGNSPCGYDCWQNGATPDGTNVE